MRDLRKNKTDMFPVIALIFLMLVTCGGCGSNSAPAVTAPEAAGLPADFASYSFDLSAEDIRTTPVDECVTCDPGTSDGELLIEAGGDYLLSGNYRGKIRINAGEYPVHLFLSGADITSEDGSAILVESASKVILTLVDQTENKISDSPYYSDEPDRDACLYSVPDLTINGKGRLVLRSFYEDGIHTKDILRVLDATLDVQSKGDGIKGNDGVLLQNTEVTVGAEKNGIRTNKNGKDVKGSIIIRDTTLSVIAGRYALESYDGLVIAGSGAYLNGIHGATNIAGEQYVEEGNLLNE